MKFRWWCFINKLRMLKANAKYKKLKKSGEKIEIRIISESFPEPPWMEKTDYKSKEEKDMSNKLDYEIPKRYSHELGEIANKLDQLENGRVYELSRTTMDEYLATNIKQLRRMIAELLDKIQNDEQGTSERISEMINQL